MRFVLGAKRTNTPYRARTCVACIETPKKRTTATKKPGPKPAGPLPAPQDLLETMLADTARTLMQRIQTFEQLATEFPNLTGITEARIKLQVAALALCDATDAAAGRPLTYETKRTDQAR